MTPDQESTAVHMIGNIEDGWLYNQGKCRNCEIALMGDIPPGTDLDTLDFPTRDICGVCETELFGERAA